MAAICSGSGEPSRLPSHMARALAGGMLAAGYEASHIAVSEPLEGHRLSLARELPGTVIFEHNEDAVRKAECVVLAVKPQIMADVLPTLKVHLGDDTVVLSIAAGCTLARMQELLGGEPARARLTSRITV